MNTHTGPVQVRFSKNRVTVLCPLGHYVTSSDLKDWAGSALEAKIAWHQHGDQPWIVTCEGALPK